MSLMKFHERRRTRRDLCMAVFTITIAVWIFCEGFAVAQDQETGKAIQQANSLSHAFRSASGKVLPTVVTIRTSIIPRKSEQSDRLHGRNPFQGTPFEDFFDDELPEGFMPDGPMPPGMRFYRVPMRPQKGMGSGVIIDPSGVVLTNHHVVDGADRVTVELADQRRFTVTEIKFDEKTDLAVLRIKPDAPLPAAKLGDSGQLAIGDWVIAIGNPFRLGQTVSAGIISATGRTLRQGQWTNYLQTDAAINPGNSGGPLVNLAGEVVGINTAIASRNGGYQGIGFSIPSNTAKWVVEQLLDAGKVQRAYLGVSIMEPDAELAAKLGVKPGQGVLVSEVFADSPAEAAGFKPGDLVVSFAGRPTTGSRRLQSIVERCPMGSTQEVRVLRDGKMTTLSMVARPLPDDLGQIARETGTKVGKNRKEPASFGSEMLGAKVSDLTPGIAKHLGYEGTAGVVITEIDPSGMVAQAGLRPGAIILQVDRKPVKDVVQFETAIKNASLADGVLLLVRMGRGQRYVVLKSP